ncbi:MAG: MTH1187 family thiamine-binding protein [Bacteroidetes bacterium]|nr:MTH1187 family thiamine-binding protein [Bacteroidota bacterium]
MSVLLEFAMFPTDKGESVSDYVAKIIAFIDKSGVNYQLTPMGTIVETETFEEALFIIKGAYEVLATDSNRIYSSLKFDIRKGKSNRMQSKMKSIEDKLNKKF